VRAPALAALGLVAYAVFLLATLPASYVLARAQAAAPGTFEVRESRGTAWRGTGALSLATAAGRVELDRVEWHWEPARLLAGRLAWSLAAHGPSLEARGEAARSPTRWMLRGFEARGEAASITAIVPAMAAWRPEGSMSVTAKELDSDGSQVRGEASIEWRAAAVALSDVKPLGSYRAVVNAEGAQARFLIETLEGPLRIAGKGTVSPPTRLAFTGEARAEPAAGAALEPLLRLFGPVRADGAHAIDWRTP